jgi:ACS family pantothenate transporter-like MFS transporter
MQFFALWLKSEKTYSVPQINNLPTVIGAINFFFMLTSGYASDKIGSRGPVCIVVGIILSFCYIILTIWDTPNGLKMAAFFLTGCYGCFSPLMAGWVNSVCGGDQQLRAFTLAFMGSVGQAVAIPFQQFQFPSSQAPKYAKTHGYGSALAFVVALTLWLGFGVGYIEKKAPRWFKTKELTSASV